MKTDDGVSVGTDAAAAAAPVETGRSADPACKHARPHLNGKFRTTVPIKTLATPGTPEYTITHSPHPDHG